MLDTGPGELPRPGDRTASGQAGLLPQNSPQPAKPSTNAAREVSSHAGGKGHSHWLSVSGGERKMEDLDVQLCPPEETSSAGLVSLSSTDNMYNGIIIIIQWLRQLCGWQTNSSDSTRTCTKFLM